jgi:flagellar biosynthetic protein FlhB
MADRGQQTEKATPRHIEKARREGRFATSRELVGAVQFVAFVILLEVSGGGWLGRLRLSTRSLLAEAFRGDVDPMKVLRLLYQVTFRDLLPFALAGGVLVAVTLSTQLASTRFGFAPKKLAPDVKKLNIMARLRELPHQNLMVFTQALLLLPLFGLAVHAVVKNNLEALVRLPFQSAEQGARQLGASIQDLFWKAALVFVALGCLDFWRQHRRYLADLRMTKQEVREEAKETEGNPQIRARVRRLRRDLLRRQMMRQVPKATAVIVNPIHYAVAIRYRLEASSAPTVVAKGKNYLAVRIRQKAIEHQVPVVENPPLAQALYKSTEVGQEIPVHLYRAVAEILAYIYRLMGGRLP